MRRQRDCIRQLCGILPFILWLLWVSSHNIHKMTRAVFVVIVRGFSSLRERADPLLDVLKWPRGHWLPVWQHVRVQGLHPCPPLFGHASSYLAEDCCLVTDARLRKLHSAETRTLLVSLTWTNFDDRAFSAAGSRIWKYLLSDLKEPDLSSFLDNCW